MLSKEVSSAILKFFGMTWPGIEPYSPGQSANSQPNDPIPDLKDIQFLYAIYITLFSVGEKL